MAERPSSAYSMALGLSPSTNSQEQTPTLAESASNGENLLWKLEIQHLTRSELTSASEDAQTTPRSTRRALKTKLLIVLLSSCARSGGCLKVARRVFGERVSGEGWEAGGGGGAYFGSVRGVSGCCLEGLGSVRGVFGLRVACLFLVRGARRS